jgi:hypothetical protein
VHRPRPEDLPREPPERPAEGDGEGQRDRDAEDLPPGEAEGPGAPERGRDERLDEPVRFGQDREAEDGEAVMGVSMQQDPGARA